MDFIPPKKNDEFGPAAPGSPACQAAPQDGVNTGENDGQRPNHVETDVADAQALQQKQGAAKHHKPAPESPVDILAEQEPNSEEQQNGRPEKAEEIPRRHNSHLVEQKYQAHHADEHSPEKPAGESVAIAAHHALRSRRQLSPAGG